LGVIPNVSLKGIYFKYEQHQKFFDNSGYSIIAGEMSACLVSNKSYGGSSSDRHNKKASSNPEKADQNANQEGDCQRSEDCQQANQVQQTGAKVMT
jgi:hypothetical protein